MWDVEKREKIFVEDFDTKHGRRRRTKTEAEDSAIDLARSELRPHQFEEEERRALEEIARKRAEKIGDKVWMVEGQTDMVWSVAITPDDKKVVTGSDDGAVKVWDMETGELLCDFEAHTKSVESVAIHPWGEFIATGSEDTTWKLWDFKSKELLYTSHVAHGDGVNDVIFSVDGECLISCSFDKTIIKEGLDHRVGRLPISVHQTFTHDCKLEDEVAEDFDWSKTEIMAILKGEGQRVVKGLA